MSSAIPDSRTPGPFGRGLDLDSLAAAAMAGLDAPPPPQVDGYTMETLLGTGGLGRVWKAVRLADQVTVALKIPHRADPSFTERLHVEAQSLRALDHPHILGCFSHGTTPDGLPWLALEYVHGAPLSALIPPRGFPWSEALDYFRRIASAVSHAHRHGVLHRDLKPSNILIGHDGSLKVADFGFARSVTERVITFSLTLSGHVAGTAEYLAPECYARDYRSAPAADLYALGVILYELLAGHPPRGAWTPVSQLKQVDIRVDEMLHRAMDPDPAKRFPSVQAMLDELEGIARTPARYSGTPRLTRAVRFLDFVWTCIGLFLFLGSLGVVVRIEKYGIGLPVDLIGTETIRIGTYQSILLLLVCAFPFGLWQLFRLWHFRKVPMREALPAPFGLKLGTQRTAAFIVVLAQILFLVAPGVMGGYSWRERCVSWLNETSPPWEQGLVVSTHPEGRVSHDPWAWPEADREYYLRERSGWITDPLSTQFDMTSYWPGVVPRLIAGLAVFYAGTIVLTVFSAFSRWWRFRKWGQSLALLAVIGLGARSMQAALRSLRVNEARGNANWNYGEWNAEYHTRPATDVRRHLFPAWATPAWLRPPKEMLAQYAPTVVFSGGPPRSGPSVADWLADHAAQSRRQHRTAASVQHVLATDSRALRFLFKDFYLDCTDPPDGPSTGALTILALHGNILPKIGGEITDQWTSTLPLWSAERRVLTPAEGTTWADTFMEALQKKPASPGAARLEELFYPWLLQFFEYDLPARGVARHAILDALRGVCDKGASPRLVRPPDPAVSAPGGRQRLKLEIEDRGQPTLWTVDLIFTGGRWQCVRMEYNR